MQLITMIVYFMVSEVHRLGHFLHERSRTQAQLLHPESKTAK